MSKYSYLVAREGEGFPMLLEEGTATRVSTFRADTGVVKGCTYASQIEDGDHVQIYANSGVDRCVQISSTGITIGYIDGEPIYENPSSTQTTGNYTRARGNVILQGGNVHRVKLDAANQAIVPGYYLAIDTTNKEAYDREEDTTTNVIALENADSSSGASILAFVVGRPAVESDAGA